jgi:hypothetical protein
MWIPWINIPILTIVSYMNLFHGGTIHMSYGSLISYGVLFNTKL